VENARSLSKKNLVNERKGRNAQEYYCHARNQINCRTENKILAKTGGRAERT